MKTGSPEDYDVVLVGAGPSNLAVMAAMEECFPDTRFLALERRPGFEWHPGMLFPGTTLQNSFLKDAATLRDPRSKFTFLNFLHCQGRLGRFIDRGNHPVSRIEITRYMEWIAGELGDKIRYGAECLSIFPEVEADHGVRKISIETDGGTLSARHVVIGIGASPALPEHLPRCTSVAHASEYVRLRPQILAAKESRILIVGGGQSAAEICLDILQQAPGARVSVLSRQFLFRSLEANSFINRLFTEAGHLTFYELDAAKRRHIAKELRRANYSAVNEALVSEIYRHCYEASVLDDASPLALLPYCNVERIDSEEDVLTVQWTDMTSNQRNVAEFDFVVCASGYDYRQTTALLDPLAQFSPTGPRFERHRDYSLKLDNTFRPKIFVHSLGDGTFGVAEGNMTNHAIRAGAIAGTIADNLR